MNDSLGSAASATVPPHIPTSFTSAARVQRPGVLDTSTVIVSVSFSRLTELFSCASEHYLKEMNKLIHCSTKK